jgi:hypothetical protein
MNPLATFLDWLGALIARHRRPTAYDLVHRARNNGAV